MSLTFLRCVGGSVSGQGCKHLPPVLPPQPGPQEQDRIQLSARYDVCRYVSIKPFIRLGLKPKYIDKIIDKTIKQSTV